MDPAQAGSRVRVPYIARCEARVGSTVLPGLIYDVSPFGCFVHVDPPPEGEFELRFALPDGGPLVVATAAVTWVRTRADGGASDLPVGCGVRFVLMSQSDRKRVETLVEIFRRTSSPLLGAEQPYSQSVRVPLIAPCRLTGDFGHADGRTCNLSIFGIYAAVDPIPAAGTSVRVEVWLNDRPEPFARLGTVTWRNVEAPTWERPLSPGCGVRFEQLSLKDVRFLSSLVEEGIARMGSPAK